MSGGDGGVVCLDVSARGAFLGGGRRSSRLLLFGCGGRRRRSRCGSLGALIVAAVGGGDGGVVRLNLGACGALLGGGRRRSRLLLLCGRRECRSLPLGASARSSRLRSWLRSLLLGSGARSSRLRLRRLLLRCGGAWCGGLVGSRVCDTRAGRGDCVDLLVAVLELGGDGFRGSGGSGEEVEAEVDAKVGELVIDEVAVAVAEGHESVACVPR